MSFAIPIRDGLSPDLLSKARLPEEDEASHVRGVVAGEPRVACLEGGRLKAPIEAAVPGLVPEGKVPEDLELVVPVGQPHRRL